ncbi:MAG: universal stress protein [Nitrospirae bacterium]|nr:universal stress protein [Nitrospirota bacterium]
METKMDYMGPLKNILLATDGSEYSEGAIKEAIYLAKSCIEKLSVIYVLKINPEIETEGQKIVERMEIAAKEHLDRIRKMAARDNVECEVIVRRTDQPYKAIVEEAGKRNADVIVMGRRGRTGLKKVLMGSVTAKVIGYSPCKVLVVPKDSAIKADNIMVATDGSKYCEAAEREAISMSKRCHLKVKKTLALSVAPTDSDLPRVRANVERVKEMAREQGVEIETLAMVGRRYEMILKAAREKNADIIIMGTYGRTGIERLLMGSVSERVVGLSQCPVLVVKE